jgi:uridine phosphorylase
MTFPNFPGKYEHPSIFTARDVARHRPWGEKQLPPNVIICFQRAPQEYLKRTYRGRKAGGIPADFITLKGTPVPVGVAGGFGIGAPAAVAALESMAALGARRFIVVGWAGGLTEDLEPGQLIVCSAALRDEGTSHHYLPPARYAKPDAALTACLSAALDEHGCTHLRAPTWTTDAPYRETMPEVRAYAAEGVRAVDMEAAALFAAAQYLGVQAAAGFSVGDSLKDGAWQIGFNWYAMNLGLHRMAEAAVQAFARAG